MDENADDIYSVGGEKIQVKVELKEDDRILDGWNDEETPSDLVKINTKEKKKSSPKRKRQIIHQDDNVKSKAQEGKNWFCKFIKCLKF